MAAHTYIMEDAREAARLAAKVNADEWVAKYLREYLPPNGRVLEVGCGPGVLLRAAAKQDPTLRLTGMDLSPARVREAQERNADLPQLQIVRGDAAAIEFPSGSFDVVYSRFLLEYLPDKEQAVREMARVCRPGGTVLLQDLDALDSGARARSRAPPCGHLPRRVYAMKPADQCAWPARLASDVEIAHFGGAPAKRFGCQPMSELMSCRLALVEVLLEAVQQQVREGDLGAGLEVSGTVPPIQWEYW